MKIHKSQIILFTFLLISGMIFISHPLDEEALENTIGQFSPKISADAPIFINSDMALDAYCTLGNGSAENPYIIDNLVIAASSDGISLSNIDAFLTVRNCTVTGGTNGISLFSCANITLSNNNCTGAVIAGIYIDGNSLKNSIVDNNASLNSNMGIWVSTSDENIIMGNNCSNNSNYGITVNAGSDGNAVSNNYCVGNGLSGISVSAQSDECIIKGNVCSLNGGVGIEISTYSDGNLIRENFCADNTISGIDLLQSSGNIISDNFCTHSNKGLSLEGSSDFNLIIDNDFPANGRSISITDSNENTMLANNCTYNSIDGIRLKNANFNEVSQNNCSENGQSSMKIESSNQNQIWNNVFYSNGTSEIDYQDGSFQNQFYSGETGNYWGDYENTYTTALVLQDGQTWNTPYEIGLQNEDPFPLVYPFGVIRDDDMDGLSNAYETLTLGSEPDNIDTDGDGVWDGWEVEHGTNILVSDSEEDPDYDSLDNLGEFTHGTDPYIWDSDGDDIPDGWEVTNGLNPLVDDSWEDPDQDGITNFGEFTHGTDPNQADSEDDDDPDPDEKTIPGFRLIPLVAVSLGAFYFVVHKFQKRLI